MANPYRDLSAEHFWKTIVDGYALPIPAKRFAIEDDALVATAGSCFAQEIGRRLSRAGGPIFLRAEHAGADQPLFSALYGNVYTVRQLVQLFDRAFDTFAPAESAWQRSDGRYVDPFRPFVFADGFATPADVEAARDAHLHAVRSVFSESTVFVFTLGLTECWYARADGAVFPVAPGVVADRLGTPTYAFTNFGYAEVLADARAFVERIRSVNPSVDVIFSLSPVPLIATYTNDHVLIANTKAKAVLRAVCAAVEAEYAFAYYFPSYELIASHITRGRFYDANMRTIDKAGVDCVMELFAQTYRGGRATIGSYDDDDDESVCDEAEIPRSIGF